MRLPPAVTDAQAGPQGRGPEVRCSRAEERRSEVVYGQSRRAQEGQEHGNVEHEGDFKHLLDLDEDQTFPCGRLRLLHAFSLLRDKVTKTAP